MLRKTTQTLTTSDLKGAHMTDNSQQTTTEPVVRKEYSAPAIVHELKMETRAGSPLRPGVADPLGIDPTNPQAN
jgi:hypothetical protein